MSALPQFSMRDLLDAGVHFGHKAMRWNPKMSPFLYGVRNGVHIIDLQQTVPMLYRALKAVYDVSARNGRILFVGTKRQASDIITDSAKRCGQYYVNHRWLGGMLTNWDTVSGSIKTLRGYEQMLHDASIQLNKKERLTITRKMEKLDKTLGGIKEMPRRPDLVVVIDTNKEDIAVAEANKLGIPVVAVLDSNCNPDGIDYPIPGNDDATKAIQLYCRLISDAVLAGIKDSMSHSGVDVGEAAEVPAELTPEQEGTAKAANNNEKEDREDKKGRKQKQAPKAPVVQTKKEATRKAASKGDETQEVAAEEEKAKPAASAKKKNENKKK